MMQKKGDTKGDTNSTVTKKKKVIIPLIDVISKVSSD